MSKTGKVLPFVDKQKEAEIAEVAAALMEEPNFQAHVYLVAIGEVAKGDNSPNPKEVGERLDEVIERIAAMRWLIEVFCKEKFVDPDADWLIETVMKEFRKEND